MRFRDDVAMVDLTLSDNFKSTLLAGYSPDVIMDVASRAISFWNYQQNQELVYQQWVPIMINLTKDLERSSGSDFARRTPNE